MKIYTAYALHVVHAHVQGTESHMPLIYYILGCYSHDLKVPYCLVENIEKFSPMLHMGRNQFLFTMFTKTICGNKLQ